MGQRELTDSHWPRLRPMLPPQKPRTGRPANDHRTVLEGLLWILRTGAPWRDLPRRFGSRGTVSSRFYRWRQTGVWERLLAALQREADADGRLDWPLPFVDGTTVRAHQHATGAKGSDGETEALGRSRGGFSAKIHVRAERRGKPVVFAVTPGQRHEQTAVERSLDRGAVKRRGRGRPRVRPDRLGGDKGYSSGTVRRALRRRGIGTVVPRKTNERRDGRFDRAADREQNRVERPINRLKEWRRVATRYETRAANYAAMLTIAAILLWL
jgi:transposase